MRSELVRSVQAIGAALTLASPFAQTNALAVEQFSDPFSDIASRESLTRNSISLGDTGALTEYARVHGITASIQKTFSASARELGHINAYYICSDSDWQKWVSTPGNRVKVDMYSALSDKEKCQIYLTSESARQILSSNLAQVTAINNLDDAKRFIEILQIPDQYQSPTPEQVLAKAREINSFNVFKVVNSDVWVSPDFKIRCLPADAQHIDYSSDRFALYDANLDARRNMHSGISRIAPLVSEQGGARLVAQVIWSSVQGRDIPELARGEVRYKDINTHRSWSDDVLKSSHWETDPVLIKAQQKFLEAVGLPKKNTSNVYNQNDYSPEEIIAARKAAVASSNEIEGRAADLYRESKGLSSLKDEQMGLNNVKQPWYKSFWGVSAILAGIGLAAGASVYLFKRIKAAKIAAATPPPVP